MSKLLPCVLTSEEWDTMQSAQQNGTWPDQGFPFKAVACALLKYQMTGKQVRPVFRLREPAQQKWMEAS